MGAFAKNIRRQAGSMLKPVLDVLCAELDGNKADVQDRLNRLVALKGKKKELDRLVSSEGFKEVDCRMLLKHLSDEIAEARNLTLSRPDRLACCGDSCLAGNLPEFSGKVLDVLILATQGMKATVCWMGGDCKFGLKPHSYGLFTNERSFREEVDEKFENVSAHLQRIGERLHNRRLILVTRHAFPQCQRMFNSLKMGKKPHGIIKGNYSFQTITTMANQLKKRTWSDI